ncbi:hypothetical protein ACFX2G_044272 [Malus domestica]
MKAINFHPVYDVENKIGEYLVRVSWYTWRTVFVTWITEFDDDYELVASVYDALVKACTSLKSIRGVKRPKMFCMERKKKRISLKYRSDLLKFRRVMEEMRLSVTNADLELMNRTPFGRLFKAYCENLIIDGVCRKCDANIVSILKCCDPVQKAFVLGGITATITAKDIAEIFRLPNEGEEINLNSRRRKNVKDISKKILEERILRVVKMHGSVHEGDLCDWFVYIFA